VSTRKKVQRHYRCFRDLALPQLWVACKSMAANRDTLHTSCIPLVSCPDFTSRDFGAKEQAARCCEFRNGCLQSQAGLTCRCEGQDQVCACVLQATVRCVCARHGIQVILGQDQVCMCFKLLSGVCVLYARHSTQIILGQDQVCVL
jgi:hypothetical protein